MALMLEGQGGETGGRSMKGDRKAKRPMDREKLLDRGRCVFIRMWDSGGPGAGAGDETVYRYRGKYWAVPSYGAIAGPFDSLSEALRNTEVAIVTGATESIDCGALTAEEICKCMPATDLMEPRIVEVNEEEWVFAPGRRFGRLDMYQLAELGYLRSKSREAIIDAWLRYYEDTAKKPEDPRQQQFDFGDT